MRAITKNLIPQLAQSSAEPRPIPALFLDDSVARIPIVDLKEIRQLSGFLPLVVLIPKSCLKDQAISTKIAASKPLNQNPEAAKVLTHPRCLNCHPRDDRPLAARLGADVRRGGTHRRRTAGV